MNSPIIEQHWNDENGCPEGGQTFGDGFAIAWQRGPLGRGENRKPANGAFVENILKAARGRLEFYQASKFKCDYNQRAIDAIDVALVALHERTANREDRKVEGTHAE